MTQKLLYIIVITLKKIKFLMQDKFILHLKIYQTSIIEESKKKSLVEKVLLNGKKEPSTKLVKLFNSMKRKFQARNKFV